jgi:hypothetical protein
MKGISNLIFSIIIISFFTTCKTDFDVTAPYKEIPCIYGLLNASDTVQWVRINKAFLGEGNALIMAQQPDSINYGDILDVKLEEYLNGNVTKSIPLIRDSSVIKEPGVFATTPNILYRTNITDKINAKNKYRLSVYNRETDSNTTAETVIVDSILIVSPSASPSFKINWVSSSGMTVRWYSVSEGYAYQLTIRFHYNEENISNPADIQAKYIDWEFTEKEYINGEMTIQIESDEFYRFVNSELSPNSAVKRRIGKLDFIFTVPAKEFYTYVSVNHPPTSVGQYLPQYSNINAGIGIFSSRLYQSVSDKEMNAESQDSLVYGSITGNLGFIY